jgi:hypothetical protein
MKQFNFKDVQAVNEQVQTIDPVKLTASPQLCYEMAIWAATQRAYIGEQQALAKHEWAKKKESAYISFISDNEANQRRVEKYGVSAVKDFIGAKCGEYEARHEYCERTCASLDSLGKSLMTIISSLKEEYKNAKFS